MATRMKLLQLQNVLPPGLNFDDLVREVCQADIPLTRHYSEYQSGGWWTCSLLGRSADATDGEVTDTVQPSVTDALEKLSVTRQLLQDMRLDYMLARLARFDPGGALWEHRDYQNLRQVPRQRIHLPIETNADAFMVAGGRRFHMGLASLWTFRPTTAHGACNLGAGPRVHLILDVYEDERLKKVLAGAIPTSSTAMSEISADELEAKVRFLHSTRRNGHLSGNPSPDALTHWERAVLGLYFAFAVPEGQLYDALERVCLEDGDGERASFWADRRQLVLAEGVHA